MCLYRNFKVFKVELNFRIFILSFLEAFLCFAISFSISSEVDRGGLLEAKGKTGFSLIALPIKILVANAPIDTAQ